MSALGEALIAASDTNVELTWLTEGASEVVARFSGAGQPVATAFTETGRNSWRVGFDLKAESAPSISVHVSVRIFRIFSSVFQAVREFLEVRRPQRLVFAAKDEDLGRLYAEYLERQDTLLHGLGYTMIAPLKSSPLMEFTIEKSTPPQWKDDRP